jgi:hypothetical protein
MIYIDEHELSSSRNGVINTSNTTNNCANTHNVGHNCATNVIEKYNKNGDGV